MKRDRNRRCRSSWPIGGTLAGTLLVIMLVTAGPVAGPALAGGDDAAAVSRTTQSQLWSQAITLLDEARSPSQPQASESELALLQADSPPVAGWLEAYREQLASRRAATREDFNKYVENAQESLDHERYLEALIYAVQAHANADDPQAVLDSDWMKKLVEASVARAEELYGSTKWMDAFSYYNYLARLFENNRDYEKRRRDCLTHARLDAIYQADRNWSDGLEGIDPEMVGAALERIHRYYVERADFQATAEAGFEHLLLICESKVMRETFDGLADDELREEFRVRLLEHLEQIRKSPGSEISRKDVAARFRRALQINRQTVQLPDELVTYEFMTGALEPLDEYTSVIWPVEFREFDKHTRGDFVGVGISISGGGSSPILVVSPLEDTPAYRAGIQAGDHITHVNGQSLEGMSLNKAVQIITGPIDTEVTLTIHRESEQRDFDLTMKRALIEIASVKGYDRKPDDPEHWTYLLDRELGVGYVRVTSFQENTVDQLRAGIEEAMRAGMHGLILDLRFNPGGLLKSAVEVAELFLHNGDAIVSTRGLRDAPWERPAIGDGPFTKLPLIVLVNESSASASEIVSGALHDHGRAIVVGERTFGKFSVQKLMQLIGSAAHLKLTTARYYLPSGRSLHREEGATEWGVSPDVEVKLAMKELGKVIELRRRSEVLGPTAPQTEPTEVEGDEVETMEDAHGAGLESGEDGEPVAKEAADEETNEHDKVDLKPDPNNRPEVDPQLDTAMLLMRLYLLGELSPKVAVIENAESADNEVRKP